MVGCERRTSGVPAWAHGALRPQGVDLGVAPAAEGKVPRFWNKGISRSLRTLRTGSPGLTPRSTVRYKRGSWQYY